MLISAKTMRRTSIFFSPKEAQLLFRQLQKLSARNIAALKCESRKTKCWVPWNPPLMQLSVKGVLHLLPQKAPKLACFVLCLKIINILLRNNVCILTLKWSRGVPMDPKISFCAFARKRKVIGRSPSLTLSNFTLRFFWWQKKN